MNLRPRGGLARTLHNKLYADEKLRQFDKNEWYHVDIQYVPRCLQSTFLQLTFDDETRDFLEKSEDKSSWVFTQVWYTFVKTFFGIFFTQTSLNGLLRRGSMFVFSLQQFLTITSPACHLMDRGKFMPRRLLDLGAGDGAVTGVVEKQFDEIYVTEVSQPMKWILDGKGYTVLDVESWAKQDIKFDVVMCLNLLDRCDRPLDILVDIRQSLKPGGIVILALVLPFRPYVEAGRPDHLPSQSMMVNGTRFEDQVNSLVHNVINPAGFVVERWTRVPYLCEGDLAQAYYWLDDVLLVLSSDESSLCLSKLED